MSYGEIIRDLRKKKGLSQGQVAIRLNVTQGAVSQWETDRTTPDKDQLISLASIFGVTVGEIMGIKETAERSDDGTPKTKEARIVSFGMDQLPEEERQKILTILQTMYTNNPALFKRSEADDA